MNKKSTVIPLMIITNKDHKKTGEDGTPAVRPICGAGTTINQRASDALTDILQSVAKSEENTSSECTSTEDYISRVEDLNRAIRD